MPLTEIEIQMCSNKITEIDIKQYGSKIIFGNELVKKYSIIDKKSDSYDYRTLIQINNINNIF